MHLLAKPQGAKRLRGYSPALVGFPTAVSDETLVGLIPFGTLYTIVATQTWQVLSCFGVLVLRQMFGGEEIIFNLIQASECPPSLRERSFVSHSHFADVPIRKWRS